jgi:hypothetical protein
MSYLGRYAAPCRLDLGECLWRGHRSQAVVQHDRRGTAPRMLWMLNAPTALRVEDSFRRPLPDILLCNEYCRSAYQGSRSLGCAARR